MHCNTLLYAPVLLTQNEQREIFYDAYIAVSNGRIRCLGSKKDMPEGLTADSVIHLDNCLAMPGLVNAHTHIAMTFLRGLADDLPLMDWLTGHIFPVERHLTEGIVHLGTRLGCAEMIKTGTTAFCDMYLFADSVSKATDECGLKVLAGEGIFNFPSPAYPTVEKGFELVERLAEKWKGHERVRPCVMPHSVYTTTPDILLRCKEIADAKGLPLVIHLAETQTETDTCLQTYGKRPVRLLDSLGLLGSGTTIAHGVELSEEELDLLARTGTHIVHNPKSNMKLASGRAPVEKMLQRGICPGLGTDGAASNNTLNMFQEMNMCALLHKMATKDPTVLPAQTVLDMATRGSAAAMHWDGIGCLEPGNAADIIALDLTAPNLQPLYSPTSHLVYAASGHEVCFSMVNGEVLYRNGTFSRMDYSGLLREVQLLKQWVLKKKA